MCLPLWSTEYVTCFVKLGGFCFFSQRFFYLSLSLAVVYGYAHVKIWMHRQIHMPTLKRKTCRQKYFQLISAAWSLRSFFSFLQWTGLEPKQFSVITLRLSSGHWSVVLVSQCICCYNKTTLLGCDGADTVWFSDTLGNLELSWLNALRSSSKKKPVSKLESLQGPQNKLEKSVSLDWRHLWDTNL